MSNSNTKIIVNELIANFEKRQVIIVGKIKDITKSVKLIYEFIDEKQELRKSEKSLNPLVDNKENIKVLTD